MDGLLNPRLYFSSAIGVHSTHANSKFKVFAFFVFGKVYIKNFKIIQLE